MHHVQGSFSHHPGMLHGLSGPHQWITLCLSLLFAGDSCGRGGDRRGYHGASRVILLELGRDGRGSRLWSLTESAERGGLLRGRGRGDHRPSGRLMGRCSTAAHHHGRGGRIATDCMTRRCEILRLMSWIWFKGGNSGFKVHLWANSITFGLFIFYKRKNIVFCLFRVGGMNF